MLGKQIVSVVPGIVSQCDFRGTYRPKATYSREIAITRHAVSFVVPVQCHMIDRFFLSIEGQVAGFTRELACPVSHYRHLLMGSTLTAKFSGTCVAVIHDTLMQGIHPLFTCADAKVSIAESIVMLRSGGAPEHSR